MLLKECLHDIHDFLHWRKYSGGMLSGTELICVALIVLLYLWMKYKYGNFDIELMY